MSEISANAGEDEQVLMLVEDDHSMREFLQAALVRAGFKVQAFEDGANAWDAFEAEPDRFGLLFTDVVMCGIDGVELARRIERLRPEVPILFITGFAACALESATEPRDARRRLTKPFHLSEMVEHIRKAWEARP